MGRYALVAVLLMFASPSIAADLAGTWSVKAGDAIIFRFELRHTASGWSGGWTQPKHFDTDGESFANVQGPAEYHASLHARDIENGVEMAFENTESQTETSVLRITAAEDDRAEAQPLVAGRPIALLFELTRDESSAPLGPWNPRLIYIVQHEDWPTNLQLTAMYEEDQRSRRNMRNWQAEQQALALADQNRRRQTQELIDQGLLHSSADYYHAAMIFQHGATVDDHLKAHILATIALAYGYPGAKWLAAATLDRYLQGLGRPQIFGTQFKLTERGATQEPFDPDFIPDALRKAMRVPPLGEQSEQAKSMTAKDTR